MPAPDILKAVVFCHRIEDDQDFTERIICIPPSRADHLADELRKRVEEGLIDTVQIGRIYIESTRWTPYEDEVDKFLGKIDSIRPHSSMKRAPAPEAGDSGLIPGEVSTSGFTGFDGIPEP